MYEDFILVSYEEEDNTAVTNLFSFLGEKNINIYLIKQNILYFLFLELWFDEFWVVATLLEKLLVCACLDNFALFEDIDAVWIDDGWQYVCNDDCCFASIDSRLFWTRRAIFVSNAAVASSSNNIGKFARIAHAMQMRCFWPPHNDVCLIIVS